MESDRKSNYKDGVYPERKSARNARPRLAELLESVTVPDESPSPNTPDMLNTSRADIDDGTYRNGSSSSPLPAVESSVAPSSIESSKISSPEKPPSEWGMASGESRFDTTAFRENDASEPELSESALAAKERRLALYSRRTEQAKASQDGRVSSSNNGQGSRPVHEGGSLADRLFGERQPSSGSSLGEPDAPLSDVSAEESARDETSQKFSTDWTAKFSPDAPLPTASDLSTRTTESDSEFDAGRSPTSTEFVSRPASHDRSDASALNSSSLDSNREASMKMSNPPQPDPAHSNTQPTTRRYETTGPSSSELLDPVSIKGRSDGVSIELGQGRWSDVVDALSQRLVQSTGFFRGGRVTLDVGVRPLQESELAEISKLTEEHGLTLTSVRSRSEQSCQVALAVGLAASLDAPDGLLAQPALSNYEKLEHFVYRGNLRSGQILRRAETILVLGDVNPGSQIISDSDILVWGRLRGIAHAGASGDTNAVIAALLMEPTQIRISDAIAILPEQEVKTSIAERLAGGNTSPNGVKRPEIAHSIGEDIIVDMWDESKPGGIMAFRRSL